MLTILVALTLAFPFLYKYSFVITNQFSQIPIILSFLNPDYLKNDWYVSISKSFGPRTIFAFYMAQTAKIFSLPATFFLHYLLYISLVTVATYKLTYALFKDKFISLSATICILFGTSITLGGNMLVTRDFVAPQLPLGLSLLAVSLLLEKRYFLSATAFSLASYLHPLLGFEPAFIFFSATFLALLSSKKPTKKLIINGFIPFLLFSSPALFLYLKEGIKGQIPTASKIAILAFMRNAHHFVPSFFPPSHYIQFSILLILFVIISLILKKNTTQVVQSHNVKNKFLLKFFFFSIILILLSCLIGFTGTEIAPFYSTVVLQPFRLTLFIYWICTSFIFGGIFYIVSKKSKPSLLLFIPIFLTNPSNFSSFNKVKLLSSIIGLFLIIFYKKLPKYFFIFLLIIFFSFGRFHDKLNFSSYTNYPTDADETKIALWSKENTPSNAVFLVPPEFETFRLVANRAIVVDWKAFPFQEKAMLEWANRVCNVGNINPCNYKEVTQEKVIKGYRTLNQDDTLVLREKYDFNYVVTDVTYPSFKKIYNNNKFYIYKITNNE